MLAACGGGTASGGEFSRTLTCDKVAEYAQRWPGQDIKLGPACKAANETCPGLVPDPETVSGSR
ncbi:MAG TPA: hypothetical protein VGB85_17480 [Nannocystis sp.]